MVVANDPVGDVGGMGSGIAGLQVPHGIVESGGGAAGGGPQHGRGRREECRRREANPEHEDRQRREGRDLIPLEVAAVCMTLLASCMVAS